MPKTKVSADLVSSEPFLLASQMTTSHCVPLYMCSPVSLCVSFKDLISKHSEKF